VIHGNLVDFTEDLAWHDIGGGWWRVSFTDMPEAGAVEVALTREQDGERRARRIAYHNILASREAAGAAVAALCDSIIEEVNAPLLVAKREAAERGEQWRPGL
jgi:hypothetical protein